MINIYGIKAPQKDKIPILWFGFYTATTARIFFTFTYRISIAFDDNDDGET